MIGICSNVLSVLCICKAFSIRSSKEVGVEWESVAIIFQIEFAEIDSVI